jgi:diguanylate cyclase (GGDEF)-like protein
MLVSKTGRVLEIKGYRMFNVFDYFTIHFLEGQSKKAILFFCFVLIIGIGLCDYWAGADVGLSIFYLIPISIATWFAGIRGGLIVSGLSALIWFGAKWAVVDTFDLVKPLWDAGIRLAFFSVIVFQQNALKREQVRSRRDTLTGAGNRRYFQENARRELDRSKRYNRPFTVVYMDLDNFKKVNDTNGHDTGDTLLQIVTTILKKNVRSTDTIARLGGDEYALLLPETGADEAKRAMQKIHAKLLIAMQRKNWPVTFSIGVVTFETSPDSVESMIKVVDELMYSAKRNGKNQVMYEVYKQSAT